MGGVEGPKLIEQTHLRNEIGAKFLVTFRNEKISSGPGFRLSTGAFIFCSLKVTPFLQIRKSNFLNSSGNSDSGFTGITVSFAAPYILDLALSRIVFGYIMVGGFLEVFRNQKVWKEGP